MISTGICRWLFLVVSLSTWIIETTSSKEMRVVCYYTNWSVYRPGAAKFSPQNINPYLCTHLVYAFGGFTKDNTLKPFDKYQDIEKGGYAKFTGLKTYNKNLKTLIAIGGWNEGSSRFSSMVANPDRRKELVKNVIKFLRLNHFDGLDLDWEYPAFRDGGKPRDRDNYADLVQELRDEFERESAKTGRPRLLLTMAVPAGIEYINKGFDVPKLTKYLDWMNILSYDYHSAFEPAVNHHAPLFSLEEDDEYNFDGDLNIDHTIKHYLKLGAQPDKLVVGIPTYGRSYTLFNPDAFEIGSPADGPGSMGDATRENGYLAYYEICENVKNQDWEVEQPNPDAMGPIAFKDDQWVGYDDESIVRKKAEYVAENGLGGIMFWAIDNDDFRGTCHGKPYPLIEAGREALLNAYGITEDNLVVPPSKPSKTRSRTKSKLSSRKSQSENENTVEKSSTGSRRRNRLTSKISKEEPTEAPADDSRKRRKNRRKNPREREETSSYSSLKVVTPSYTTPAPPSTPDLDGAFKCEDEGFFQHPSDCKKYFWCLSGAGDSGIVAHQFTCPAGLYFNKAADSCDYTQNVLCNKKMKKATTKEASTTSAPSSTTVSTTRAPPKITAATSRTTFRQTTTTEAYDEDDYEYEDDDEEEDKTKLKEEDPRVIKELIDLIKKAGGIEELEKQLRVSKDSSAPTDQLTTQTPLSKSLERVLSKTLKKTPASRKTAYTSLRNSRGPQNEGLRSSEEKISSRSETTRGKLSYTSISRNRPTTSKSTDDESEDDIDDIVDDEKKKKPTEKSIEYVNIRRNRISSTTNEPENNKVFNRNQILGEDDEIEEDEDDETNSNRKSSYTPQYVNIRRPKPSTTEEPETTKYVQVRRGTTESTQAPTEGTDEGTTSKYKTIRRSTTTTTQQPTEEMASRDETTTSAPTSTAGSPVTVKKYINFRRGPTTEKSTSEVDDTISRTSEIPALELDESTISTSANEASGSTPIPDVTTGSDSPQQIKNDVTNNIPAPQETIFSSSDNSNETNISESYLESSSTTQSPVVPIETNVDAKQQEKRPPLFQPRPFLKSTRGTTTPKPITEATTPKVSQSKLKYRLKIDNTQGDEETVPVKQYKTRGSSRFNSDNAARQDNEQSFGLSPQKRRISTTEKYIEDNRSYRPSELADLSSLTAVDFSKVKELDFGRTSSRRRRPVTTTTTTTEEPSDAVETSSRTPSVTRKLPSTFGRGRKIIRGNLNQTRSNTEVAPSTKKVPGFRSRSTRAPEPSTTESAYSSPKSLNVSPRNRKIIRKFRITTTTTPIPTQEDEDEVQEDILNERSNLFSLNKDSGFQQNRVEDENDDDDPSIEEEENIKLSESNIRENSAINSFGTDPKLRGKLAGSGKSFFSEKSVLNGKLSTSSYSIQTSDVYERPSVKISTEPSIVVRTRKIVRKLSPTEATVTSKKEFESERTPGRKRKIIRKLRPVSEYNRIENNRGINRGTTGESDTPKQTEAPPATTTVENSPEHLNIPLPAKHADDASESTETIDESKATTEEAVTPEKLSRPEQTSDLETTTAKQGPKRFRPKLFTLRNKNGLKTNSPDDVPNDSPIIRISNDANTSGTKRIASRGRNKIFRPKIFESKNRFRSNKEESASSERRFSSTPRYSSYSRRPSTLKSTEAESISSVESDVVTDSGISSTEAEEVGSTESETVGSTEYAVSSSESERVSSPESEQVSPSEYRGVSSTESDEVIPSEYQRVSSPESEQVSPSEYQGVSSTEPEEVIPSEYQRVSSTESEEVTTTETDRVSSTENALASQVSTAVDNDDEEFIEDGEDQKILGGVVENRMTDSTPTESPSSKRTESTTSRYNRFKRPNGRPYFLRSKTTTTEKAQEISPEENEMTVLLSTTPAYIGSISQSTENDISASELTTVDDHTSESIDVINTTNYETNNFTEASTTEFITTINDLGTSSMPETHTDVDLDSTDVDIQTTEGASTLPAPYDITTLESLETNEIDNTILNDSLSYLDTSTPHGQESVDVSSDETETTKSEPTVFPGTTEDLESVKETVSIVSSPAPSESSTQYHRAYTLRPVGARPKFIPPRLKDLSIGRSTESPLKSKLSKVYGGNRFRSTTADDSSIDNEELEASVPEESVVVDRPKLPTKISTTERNRFSKYKKGYGSGLRTTERGDNPVITEDNRVESSSVTSINRFLYKYSTTKHYDLKFVDDEEEPAEDDEEEPADDVEDVDGEEEDFENEEETASQGIGTGSKAIKANSPDFIRKPSTRISNKPIFSKPSTEDSRIEEALKDIDTEAIKNRNKSLFSKKRVMNTPFAVVHSSTSEMTTEVEETTSTDNDIDSQYPSTEAITKSTDLPQTTESATTFHHVFAELSDDPKQTTEAPNDKPESTTNRVERLIEVNRITNVETKEEHVKNHVVELKTNGSSQIQDKVGEVNRITVIKVVDTDGNEKVPISPVYVPLNSSSTESAIKSSVDMIIQIAKVQEIPATDMLGKVNLTNISVSLNTSSIPLSPNREGRKFEIFGVGGSKIVDNKHVNQYVGKAQIIDGISNINVITPRLAQNPESSTIPLEGLFQTEGPTLFSKNPTISDELLEAEHSKFVNVRVLHPDESVRANKEARNGGKVIPIKILKQDDEEYAMKADVVEIPAESRSDTIRIAPIKVQMSKSIANKLPLIRLGGKSLRPA